MVDNAVILKKTAHIRHNLFRLNERKNVPLSTFKEDVDLQDIVLHNLQLAIQGCIDIGSHIVSYEGWGVAGSLNEIFYILQERGVIAAGLVEKMVLMVGFRNILVHEYEDVDLGIVYDILQSYLKDIDEFLLAVVESFKL